MPQTYSWDSKYHEYSSMPAGTCLLYRVANRVGVLALTAAFDLAGLQCTCVRRTRRDGANQCDVIMRHHQPSSAHVFLGAYFQCLSYVVWPAYLYRPLKSSKEYPSRKSITSRSALSTVSTCLICLAKKRPKSVSPRR